MLKELFLAGNIISLLLTPFSFHPSVSVSGISNVIADQVTNIKNIDVEYSSGSETVSGTINAHNVWLLSSGSYLRCTNWDSTAGACKVYQLSASPSSGSNVYINEADQTYSENGTVTYSGLKVWFTQEDVIKIAFNDGKLHSGSMTISPSASYYGFQSDDPNVQVIGTTIYFFNVGAFDITHEIPHRLQGNWNTTSFTYTLSDLVEYSVDSLDELTNYAKLIYKTVDSNEIGSYMYWQTLGGVLREDNDLYFHHNFRMTNYSDDQKYTLGKNLLVRRGEPMYLSFYSSMYLAGNRTPVVYSATDVVPELSMIQYSEIRGLYYYTFKLEYPESATGNVTACEVEYNMSGSTTVIPVYVGTGIGLSQDERSAFGIDDDLVNPSVNAADQTDDNFNTAAGNLISQEDNWNNQMNQSINAIDFNGQVTTNASFLGAANFLVTMFNLMTNNNPFGYFIIFFAIICIAKILIGRKKK